MKQSHKEEAETSTSLRFCDVSNAIHRSLLAPGERERNAHAEFMCIFARHEIIYERNLEQQHVTTTKHGAVH